MKWNLRLTAAEQGIWKSTEMRRQLADAGLEISAGAEGVAGSGEHGHIGIAVQLELRERLVQRLCCGAIHCVAYFWAFDGDDGDPVSRLHVYAHSPNVSLAPPPGALRAWVRCATWRSGAPLTGPEAAGTPHAGM